MSDDSYIHLDLSLLESTGLFGAAGGPSLLCTFHAIHLPGSRHDGGKAFVAVREGAVGAWREHTRRTTVEQAREILGLLRSLGLPDRDPNLEAVADTSEGWTRLLLHVTVNEQTRTLDVPMESSGVNGPDAGAFRALLRSMCSLAGYVPDRPGWQ